MKRADSRALADLTVELWRQVRGLQRFSDFLGTDVVLVPVPGSAARPGARWVGEQLAGCLQALALGRSVWTVLRRDRAVRKSATAPTALRPSVREHYASFAVDRTRIQGSLDAPARLVLVDDVITRGRTMLAAAARLREAFPNAEIRGFALLRTLARGETVRCNPDPCEGMVRWWRGDARRSP